MKQRLRATWAAAHAPVAGVPHWAQVAAFTVPFTVLPSSLWRIAVCTLRVPIAPPGSGDMENSSSGIPGLSLAVYVVLLSIVSELLAFTSVGLIARWGEVFPRWLPVLRGRPVPLRPVVVVASAGAAVLTALWTWTAVAFALGRRVNGSRMNGPTVLEWHDWQGWLVLAAYGPLLLWGPLLAAVTVAYWKRRRSSFAAADQAGAELCSPATMAA